MDIRGPILIIAVGATMSVMSSCSGQNSQLQPPFLFLFNERPFHMDCADRPSPLPPGTHAWVTISPQAPYARTSLETLNIPRYEVPALTIAAEPTNWIQVQGANQDHWTLRFCAKGEGNTAQEASGYMQKISMDRTGGLLTLDATDSRGLTGGQGHLLVDAPADAPVTVHSWAAVEVHDMDAPVRITATRGRATIFNTSGLVDASGFIVDFAGSQGTVWLDASWDIDLGLTATKFRGSLNANAQRNVQVILPPNFQTTIDVTVKQPKDFICRADFCSNIKKSRENYWYRFSYGDAENSSDHITLHSENAKVTLDTAHGPSAGSPLR